MVLWLFVSLSALAQTEDIETVGGKEHSFQDLVGTWRNKSGMGLDIVDSNTVYLVRGDQRKLARATISDVTKVPVTFNLTVQDSARIVTLKGLVMLVGENMLQWQVFDTETKPASFSSNSGSRREMMFLKRIDELIN